MPEDLSNSFSRDCLETQKGLRFMVPRACGTRPKGTISGASRYQEPRDPTRTTSFQTVSRRGILRSSVAVLPTLLPQEG